ncbi:MAG TPA: hypothetical protein DF296_10790, partial [Candidatus Margulisbacteria bacterium]|nr:hypothetical protein [Candidatus Margulisiibacteriota bacterium]
MKKLIVVLLSIFTLINVSFATEKQKKLKPASNYQFLFVHGVSSWDQEWYKDGVISYLKDIGIPEPNMHAYSFSHNEQSAFLNAREFGDRSYTKHSKKYVVGADSPITGGNNNLNYCWIEQATADYKAYYEKNELSLDGVKYSNAKTLPSANIPTHNFVFTHSYGNFAVRGYLASGGFTAGGKRTDGTPWDPLKADGELHKIANEKARSVSGGEILDALEHVEEWVKDRTLQISEDDYKKNFVEKSFYKDDIDKVVFLSAPFTGSDMAALASLRAYVLGGVQWDKGTELLGNARTYYDLILAALDMKKKQEELSDLERRLPGLTRDPGLVNTLFIPYLIDDIAKNGMRFTPEMYYPVFSNYVFYRVMNSQVRQSGGWSDSRDMFHDLAPNGDP